MTIDEAIHMYEKDSIEYNILKYIKTYGSITRLDGVREWEYLKVPTRISDIRKKGIPIKTVMEKNTKRKGQHARYYWNGEGKGA